MKRKIFNIIIYVPFIIFIIQTLIPMIQHAFNVIQVEFEDGTTYEYLSFNLFKDFLAMAVFGLFLLIISICISNERKRVNLFGIIPIILLLIYGIVITNLSKGALMLTDVSIGISLIYLVLYIIKIIFFYKKEVKS